MDDQQIIDLYFARNEQASQETEAKYGRLCRPEQPEVEFPEESAPEETEAMA